MAQKITIKFTQPVADEARKCTPICRMFEPQGCMADLDVMGVYKTNVDGFGDFAMPLADYVAAQVAHPGLVAALKQAVKNGEYAFEGDEKAALYAAELKDVLAGEGFEITVGDEIPDITIKVEEETE